MVNVMLCSVLVTGVGASMLRPVAMWRWEGGFLQK